MADKDKQKRLSSLNQDVLAVGNFDDQKTQQAQRQYQNKNPSASMPVQPARQAPLPKDSYIVDNQPSNSTGNAVILTVIICVFLFGGGVGGFYFYDQISKMQQRFSDSAAATEAVLERVQTLESRLNSADDEASKLGGEAQSNLLAMGGKIRRLSSDVEKLSGDVGASSGRISSNTQKIKGLEGKSGAIGGQVASKLAVIEGDLKKLRTDITSLKGIVNDSSTSASQVKFYMQKTDKLENDIRSLYRLIEANN